MSIGMFERHCQYLGFRVALVAHHVIFMVKNVGSSRCDVRYFKQRNIVYIKWNGITGIVGRYNYVEISLDRFLQIDLQQFEDSYQRLLCVSELIAYNRKKIADVSKLYNDQIKQLQSSCMDMYK